MVRGNEANLWLCRPNENNCKNNGTCYTSNLGNKLCSCQLPYYGPKCQLTVPDPKEYENLRKVMIDRTLTITGIIITCCIMVLILVISWYISWRRRKDYENWKTNRRKCYRFKTIQVDFPDPRVQKLQQELQRLKCDSNSLVKKVSIGINTSKQFENYGHHSLSDNNCMPEATARKLSFGGTREQELSFRGNPHQMQLLPFKLESSKQLKKEPLSLYDENSDSESEFILNSNPQQKPYSRYNSYPPQSTAGSIITNSNNNSNTNSRHRTSTDPITSLPAMESETTALLSNYSPSRTTVQKRSSGNYPGSMGIQGLSGHYPTNGSPYISRGHNTGEILSPYPISARYHSGSLVRGEHHYSNPYVNLMNRSSNAMLDHPLYHNDLLAHHAATDNFYNSSSGCTNLNYLHQSHHHHPLPPPPPPPLNHQPYSYHPQSTRLLDEMNHMSPAALRVASEHDALLHELIDRGYATYEHQHSNNFLASSRSRQVHDPAHYTGRSGVF